MCYIFVSSLFFCLLFFFSFSPHDDICVCALAGGGVIAVEIINSVEYFNLIHVLD